MIHNSFSIKAIAGVLFAVLLSAPAHAVPEPEAWPCEQVYVPEVSAAVLWAGPPLDTHDPQAWQSDQSVARLVRFMTSRPARMEDIESRLARFLETVSGAQKNQKLALVFAGSLEVMNKRRSMFLDGILNFSRQQTRRAAIIDDSLARLAAMKAGGTSGEARHTLEQQLIWQQRIFDDRERSIRFLCDQPVDVEVALGELARALSNRLNP
jgi:hypothetical protein